MKVYGIATKHSMTYGHGDHGDELVIERTESYGTGPFPPLFTTREAAENHLSGIRWNSDKQVVEMELVGA